MFRLAGGSVPPRGYLLCKYAAPPSACSKCTFFRGLRFTQFKKGKKKAPYDKGAFEVELIGIEPVTS